MVARKSQVLTETVSIAADKRTFTAWDSGMLNQLPWLGVFSLFAVLACLIFNIVILVVCNGKVLSGWQVQPSVLLAISSTISTSLLRFAFAERAAISWWRRAIGGCTVYDLHRNWSFSAGVWEVLKNIKAFNILGLASIAALVIAIDNPLFQRAVTTQVQPVRHDLSLSLDIPQQLPYNYTGKIKGLEMPILSQMTPEFQQVVADHDIHKPIRLNNTACENGNCSVTVKAAGFAVNCMHLTMPYDWDGGYYGANGTVVGSDYKGQIHGMIDVKKTMFSTNFTHENPATHPYFNFTATFKDQASCNSPLQVKQCSFHLATLYYPVLITNGIISLVSSVENLGIASDTVVDLYNANGTINLSGSSIGGFYLAASSLFTSNSTASRTNHRWFPTISGNLAQKHLVHDDNSAHSICNYSFSDPTADIITTTQELSFRTALSVPSNYPASIYNYHDNTSLIERQETYNVVKMELESVFQVHQGYLAAGAAVMLACLIIVASTFCGWWKLGRRITMSPVEIAKAFNAPVLQGNGMDSHLNGLLPIIGNRRICYGEVKYHNGDMVFPDQSVDNEDEVQRRLELSYSHWTSRPRKGFQYV